MALHYRTLPDGISRKVFIEEAEGKKRCLAVATVSQTTGRYDLQWHDVRDEEKVQVEAFVAAMTVGSRRGASKVKAQKPKAKPQDATLAKNMGVEPAEALVRVTSDDADDAMEAKAEIKDRIAEPKTMPKIAIFCEGETELEYLKAFVAYLSLEDRVDLHCSTVKDPGSAFKSIASKVLWDRQIGICPWSDVWMVFDRDSHARYHEAYELAQHFPFMHLANTNPCFEYWLLLHQANFKDDLPLDQALTIRRQVETEIISQWQKRVVTEEVFELTTKAETCYDALKAMVPEYKKAAATNFDVFASRMALAYERARDHVEPQVGLGSTLPDLIDALCEMAGRTPQAVMADLKAVAEAAILDETLPPEKAMLVIFTTAQQLLQGHEEEKSDWTDAELDALNQAIRDVKHWLQEHAPMVLKQAIKKASFKDQLSFLVGFKTTLTNAHKQNHSRPGIKSWKKLYAALVRLEVWLLERESERDDMHDMLLVPEDLTRGTAWDVFEDDVPF